MTSRYISVTETAKIVRQSLKEAFPGVKFSVRSESYSMGASIDVYWTDGPNAKEVDKILKCFASARFDGMTDYKGSAVHSFKGEEVHFGADYIHGHRSISDGYKAKCGAAWQALSVDEHCALLNNRDFPSFPENNEAERLARFLSASVVKTSPTAEASIVIRTY